MFRKKFLRFPRRKIIRRRRALGKKRVPKSFKRYVKRAIHRNIENKEVFSYSANEDLKCVVGDVTPSGLSLIPTVNQSTNNSGRIGNSIKIVKGFIRGHINIRPYNATTNPLSTPIYVRLMLLRSLATTAQQASLTSFSWSQFFKVNGAGAAFQASMLDMNLYVNTDNWRVLSNRVFKIGAASATSAGQVGTGGYYDNSPMSVPFYFNWGRYCRKFLKYQDNNNLPTNENIYLVMQACNADGTTTATVPAEYHYVNTVLFEDA